MSIIAGRFSDLGKNKIEVLKSLYEDDDILKCLLSNEKNFLQQTIPNDYDRTNTVYNYIYPFKYTPGIQTVAKTMITCSFTFQPYKSGLNFKLGSTTFYVITHQDLISSDEGLRTDFLINKIDEIFNSSRIIGFSKMIFSSMGDIDIPGNWIYSYISYKSTEFN